ncbi:MAG: sigma-70 family RNA polymerase sigma factor [Pseudomonadota bacterium]
MREIASEEGSALDGHELPAVLKGLKAGGREQRSAVAALYTSHAGRIRGFYLRHGASAADAEEWLQDSFVRVVSGVGNFRGEPVQFHGWFWAIVRNRMIDACRRLKPQVSLDQPDDDDDGPLLRLVAEGSDPVEQLEQTSLEDCVRAGFKAFARAHPDRAQCLSWLTVDALDTTTLATLLGRTAGATREYLSQCRKKLKPFLEPCLAL